MDTIKLNARVRPKVMHVSIFYPYPGTKAYETCKKEGFLTDKQIDTYYEDSVLRQESVSAAQLRALRGRFEFLVRLYSRFYRMPGFIGKSFEKIVDLGVLAATNRRVLRALAWRRKEERSGSGPCYTLEEGEVKVWGQE